MISINGLTPRQRLVAELLWHTQDLREVERLCSLDRDARIVREMIIAGELDEVVAQSPLTEANKVLDKFRL